MPTKRVIKPNSKGGPAGRAAAKVMKEPLTKKAFPGGAKQRFAVSQAKARKAMGSARKNR